MVHAGDQEGSRICGAADGLKTVFRSRPTVIDCPRCLFLLGWGPKPRPSFLSRLDGWAIGAAAVVGTVGGVLVGLWYR